MTLTTVVVSDLPGGKQTRSVTEVYGKDGADETVLVSAGN